MFAGDEGWLEAGAMKVNQGPGDIQDLPSLAIRLPAADHRAWHWGAPGTARGGPPSTGGPRTDFRQHLQSAQQWWEADTLVPSTRPPGCGAQWVGVGISCQIAGAWSLQDFPPVQPAWLSG